MSEGTEKSEREGIVSFSEYEPFLFIDDKPILKKLIEATMRMDLDEITPEALSHLLIEDRKILRQKYELPIEDLKSANPKEYWDQLEEIAKRYGTPIRRKEEFEGFFESVMASAVYLFKEKLVIVDGIKDTDTQENVLKKVGDLEHELIHALQAIKYPGLKRLTRLEYEAYLIQSNENVLKTNPWLWFERMSMSVFDTYIHEEWEDFRSSKN
jgi:hypothetical protein